MKKGINRLRHSKYMDRIIQNFIYISDEENKLNSKLKVCPLCGDNVKIIQSRTFRLAIRCVKVQCTCGITLKHETELSDEKYPLDEMFETLTRMWNYRYQND